MLASLPLIVSLIFGFTARVDALSAATYAAAPKDLTIERAREHTLAAIAAERPGVPAELLLGMAAIESHYKANARSRGGNYCGVVQAGVGHGPGKSGLSCHQLWDLRAGYDAGARHIVEWLKQCRHRRNRLRCAIYGYGGVSVNGSVGYPGAVLGQAAKIRRELAKAKTATPDDV